MSTIKNTLVYLAALMSLTLASGSASADSDVYEKLLDSSVWIVNSAEETLGSGVVIDAEKRLVVTNYHVVGEAANVEVYFSAYDKNGDLVTEGDVYRSNYNTLHKQGMAARGRIVGLWKKRDLALIQLDTLPEDVEGVKLASSRIKPGDQLHSIGNPGASDSLWVYSPGRVRQVYQSAWTFGDGQEVDTFVIETTSPINPGDSGGPMVNSAGELVGVVSASSNKGRLMSYAIEIREIRELMAWYDEENSDDPLLAWDLF